MEEKPTARAFSVKGNQSGCKTKCERLRAGKHRGRGKREPIVSGKAFTGAPRVEIRALPCVIHHLQRMSVWSEIV